jgi:acetyltransferase-like isoleucine patch superfamily enzyme
MPNKLRRESVYIHPTAEVSKKAKIGAGTKIWNHAQIREEAEIGSNCVISKNVYIDKGVKVGNNVKIQNGISLYYGLTVEDNVLLGPHCVFTNDLYPRAFIGDYKVYPTIIRKGASIGANATIVCGITIGKFTMIGAGSVVTKNIPDFGFAFGNPAQLKGFACKCGKRLRVKRKQKDRMVLTCQYCKGQTDVSMLAHDVLGDIYNLEEENL